MEFRLVERDEIELVRKMNRSEIIDHIYYYENGSLILKKEHHEIEGWFPSNLEDIIKNLYDLYDQNGFVFGTFDDQKLIGIVALDSHFIGNNKDQLQLSFLHTDANYRSKGIGGRLIRRAIDKAKDMGAKKLYISATPSENTINFYMHLGCTLTKELNQMLYELEPEDIHLDLKL